MRKIRFDFELNFNFNSLKKSNKEEKKRKVENYLYERKKLIKERKLKKNNLKSEEK